MKRTAFTMIELIFVIVILGILASVAIPKLASVQDDATIATEKAVIGAARSGISILQGKRVTRGKDYNVTYTDLSNGEHTVTIITSATYYPTTLNVGTYTLAAQDATTTSTDTNDTASLGLYTALAQSTLPRSFVAVVEPDGVTQWANEAIVAVAATNSNSMEYVGPAGSSISDPNAEINNASGTADSWTYNDKSGTLRFNNR